MFRLLTFFSGGGGGGSNDNSYFSMVQLQAAGRFRGGKYTVILNNIIMKIEKIYLFISMTQQFQIFSTKQHDQSVNKFRTNFI